MPTQSLVRSALSEWATRARVRHWTHFLLLPLASVPEPSAPASLGALRGIAIAAVTLAYAYLVNGVADRTLDSSVRKNPFAVERDADVSAAGRMARLLAALALVLAFAGPMVVFGATVVALVAGTVYSTGPREKAIPVVGTLVNVAIFAPLLFVGTTADEVAPGLIPLAAAFGGLLVHNQLLHEAVDADDDRRGGLVTTVGALGPRPSAVLASLVGVLAVAFVADQGAGAPATLGIAAAMLPAPLALAFADAREQLKAARVAQRWASVVAGAALFGAVRAAV